MSGKLPVPSDERSGGYARAPVTSPRVRRYSSARAPPRSIARRAAVRTSARAPRAATNGAFGGSRVRGRTPRRLRRCAGDLPEGAPVQLGRGTAEVDRAPGGGGPARAPRAATNGAFGGSRVRGRTPRRLRRCAGDLREGAPVQLGMDAAEVDRAPGGGQDLGPGPAGSDQRRVRRQPRPRTNAAAATPVRR